MDFGKLPFDLQAAVIRFADSADRQAYATYRHLEKFVLLGCEVRF